MSWPWGEKRITLILEEGLWADAEENSRWTVQQGREVPVLLTAGLPAQRSVTKTRKGIQGCLALLPVSAVTNDHKFSGTLRDLEKPKEGFQG